MTQREIEHYEDLKLSGFNDEQAEFIIQQRRNYEALKEDEFFDYDSYERDMWYTMNRSGLFEKEKSNKSDITNWDPQDTRMHITEYNI